MIRNAIRRFMYGRYGNDHLNLFLIVLYLILYLVAAISRLNVLYWLSLVVVFIALFRTFSRNPVKRREENARFMKVAGPAIRWVRLRKTMRKDKEHRYFKCPSCGQQLRVPRGKGRITISCRACGASFEEKT